jgi:hypothetical protein
MDDRIQLAINAAPSLLKEHGELITGETLATLVDSIASPDQQETVELEMVGKVHFAISR